MGNAKRVFSYPFVLHGSLLHYYGDHALHPKRHLSTSTANHLLLQVTTLKVMAGDLSDISIFCLWENEMNNINVEVELKVSFYS